MTVPTEMGGWPLLNFDGSWNVSLLRQHFYPADVIEILTIKTSHREEADSIAWIPDTHGRFSVKSAYNFVRDDILAQKGTVACSTRPDGSRPGWKMLWSCGAPPKVCVFAWKAAREALATRFNNARCNAIWRLMECAPFVGRRMNQFIMHSYATPTLRTCGIL